MKKHIIISLLVFSLLGCTTLDALSKNTTANACPKIEIPADLLIKPEPLKKL